MNLRLAWTLVLVMLAVVIGQAVQLQRVRSEPVTEIRLHDSRLVAFLNEIRSDNPLTYDSIVLNLMRIRDSQGQDIQPEEVVVAEQLLARLAVPAPMARQPAAAAPAAASAASGSSAASASASSPAR